VKIGAFVFIEINEPSDWRADNVRNMIETESYYDGDVLRWLSNNHAVPVSTFADGGLHAMKPQREACEAETVQALAAYRAQGSVLNDPEVMAEARAELGEGVLVDVLTGERFN